ncbi:MAG TPA: preprotein translocase subunit SecA [candidate division Zixibacteria bacterium]
MFGNILTKIFGSKHQRDIKKIMPIVALMNQHYEEYQKLSDDQLKAKTIEFKERLAKEETLDDILPEAFAVVKDVCRRLLGKRWEVCGIEIEWDMVPYDVQLVGAVVLHKGKIAEMATGEGKTLVATMPIYLNALTGKGVHLVTVNDYLAKRDSQWMGEIYKFLGLTIGCIQNDMDSQKRKEQYDCDITYGTNNEFGFDYLRDNMAIRVEDRVQRGFNYAITDEVDNVLIDEARTPLIISGPVSFSTTQRYSEMKPLVDKLVKKQAVLVNQFTSEAEKSLGEGKTYEAGVKLLAVQRGSPKNKKFMKLLKETGMKKLITTVEMDYLRDKKINEIDEMLYYAIDERENSINMTEMGRSLLDPSDQALFVIPDIAEGLHKIDSDATLSEKVKQEKKEELYKLYAERSDKNHSITQLLKAYALFEKDVEYVVQDGKVMIVDEFTGRLLPGRRYSDGLHQAIEAKEEVRVEGETQTFATVTLQNFFRLYGKLAGMTGTAETEAAELWEIYKLDVVVIPTNESVRRIDYDDVIYRTRREKYNAIIDEIEACHKQGMPVLVGTISVEVSETLSRMLKRKGIPHSVLNAKYHQKEAEIIVQAGRSGAVTIATNMAGRGTDIKLGESVVKSKKCRLITPEREDGCPHLEELDCYENVPCGLRIIGTERHEARRIDRQLRGRSGRQGDAGSSRFFLSLEDDLMRLFGSDRIATVMDRLGVGEGEVIQHPMVTKAIQRAQRRVEVQNFAIRKHLLEYDDVMNQQREVIYDRRLAALEGQDFKEEIVDLIGQVVDSKVEQYAPLNTYPENWNLTGLRSELLKTFLVDLRFEEKDIPNLTQDALKEKIRQIAMEVYTNKEKTIGSQLMRELERYAMLRVIDDKWKEHLYEMDQLKTGIGLRAYGQKDPLIEYKKEAFAMFSQMIETIDQEVVELIFKLQIADQSVKSRKEEREEIKTIHQSVSGMDYALAQPEGEGATKVKTVRREKAKVGRNDPCPCGSGKKYKKCCGA